MTHLRRTFGRVERKAGEKEGVAKAPLPLSQRTATPTARGFWGFLKQLFRVAPCSALSEYGLQPPPQKPDFARVSEGVEHQKEGVVTYGAAER